jgi:hypothetical protein
MDRPTKLIATDVSLMNRSVKLIGTDVSLMDRSVKLIGTDASLMDRSVTLIATEVSLMDRLAKLIRPLAGLRMARCLLDERAMRRISALLATLGLLLCQCVPPAPSGVARSRGAEDLSCPIEHVRAYRAAEGLYVARGCGRWAQYDCISSGRATVFAATVCSGRGSPRVYDDPE